MLFITYTRVSWHDIRLTKFHYICWVFNTSAAPRISGTSSVERNTGTVGHDLCIGTHCYFGSCGCRYLGQEHLCRSCLFHDQQFVGGVYCPFVLSVVGKTGADVSFAASFWYIFKKVMPVIVLPFVCALLLRRVSFKTYKKVQSGQIVSFYLWAVTITILIASVTRFVVEQNTGGYTLEIFIALASLIICLLQFFFGRKIGSAFGRAIAGGQSLGQKNTVLAIWLAQTYLNPLASLGPGLYVLWQNLVNSYQIWLKKHREEKESS